MGAAHPLVLPISPRASVGGALRPRPKVHLVRYQRYLLNRGGAETRVRYCNAKFSHAFIEAMSINYKPERECLKWEFSFRSKGFIETQTEYEFVRVLSSRVILNSDRRPIENGRSEMI